MSLLVDSAAASIALRVTETHGGFEAGVLELSLSTSLRILPDRREVYSGQLVQQGNAVVGKRFLPHTKQLRDWRREWEALVQLQALGLPAPMPLCVAEESEGGAVWVLMEHIDGAVSIADTFSEADPAERLELSQQLARLIDSAHRAGVRQGDQHVDNWAWDGARLYLLDAGSIEFSKSSLNGRARLLDLAGICVTLTPEAERMFRDAVGAFYLKEDSVLLGRILYELEARIIALQGERTRRYFKKTRRSCTEFVNVEEDTFRLIHARAADAELVAQLSSDPEWLMKQGACLKDGNTCTVQEFEFNGGFYVLKRYNLKSGVHRALHVFSESRAMRSWSVSWVLRMAFVPTAASVAAYEAVGGVLAGRRYLLMERLPGCSLPEYMSAHAENCIRLEAVAESFASIWFALGRLRAAHGDLKASNIIVDEDGVVSLIDLDAFKFGLSDRAFDRGRAKDLERFMRNWAGQPELAELFKEKLRDFS